MVDQYFCKGILKLRMPCLELKPASECGSKGTCVSEPNGTETFCSCEAGWRQTLELSYFIEDDSLNSGTCFHNGDIITVLYSIVAVLSVLVILLVLCRITTKKHLIRQIPNLVMVLFMVSLSLYRLSRPESALFGYDAPFTFLVAQSWAMWALANIVFFKKYTEYLRKKISFGSGLNHNGHSKKVRERRFRIMMSIITIVDLFSLQIFWVSTFASSKKTQLILVRLIFGIQGLQKCAWLSLNLFVFGELIKDMKELLEFRAKGNYTESGAMIKSSEVEQFDRWLKRQIPKIRDTEWMVTYMCTIVIVMCTLSLSWDWYIQTWIYGIPFMIICQLLTNLVVIRMQWNRSQRVNTSSQMSKYGSKPGSKDESKANIASVNTSSVINMSENL